MFHLTSLRIKGVYTYDHKPEDDKQPGFLGQSLEEPFFKPRLGESFNVLASYGNSVSGFFFVYIFNYYIFQLVTVIKIIAAIGMALGVLYFMFFRKVELPLAALGIWIFGNGWYILAAIA